MRELRVVSYNVLSHNLSSQKRFIRRPKRDLLPEHRYPKIKAKINRQIGNKSIICLQEVSPFWDRDLNKFFKKRKYSFVWSLYGPNKGKKMGVGIAFPHEIFDLNEQDTKMISETLNIATVEESLLKPPSPSSGSPKIVYKKGVQVVKGAGVFNSARQYLNTSVSLRLTCKKNEKSFWISTYHLPVAPYQPAVQALHCAQYRNHCQNLAADLPLVVAGDFNIRPSSPLYNLMVKGKLQGDAKELIPHVAGQEYELPELNPLRSVYVEKDGSEPEFTNYAFNNRKKQNTPFIDTLDYILVSEHFTVEDVIKLPKRSDEGVQDGPNKKEPSDHLMIGCTLSFRF